MIGNGGGGDGRLHRGQQTFIKFFFLLFLCIFPLSPPLPIPVLFCIVPRARRQLYLVPLGAVVAAAAVAVALPAFVVRP